MNYEEDMKIVEAATEGPWHRNFGDDGRFMCMNWISANKEPSSNIGQYENAGTVAIMLHQGYPDVGCDRDDLNDANAEFIAHFNPLHVKQLIEENLKLSQRITTLENRLIIEKEQFKEIRAWTEYGVLAAICADHETAIEELLK